MIKLFTDSEYDSVTNKTILPLQCTYCKNKFYKNKKYIRRGIKEPSIGNFCSRSCKAASQHRIYPIMEQTLTCKECNIPFSRLTCDMTKSKNHFCSRSCSGSYNNTHKTKGNRRSKLEIYLEEELDKKYPFEILFNRKDIINSELDIFIPHFQLAFELNGIFHYEPIYGPDKLQSIQTNDSKKFQACIEKNIELCIIDTSKFSYFKIEKAKEFLSIITNIIDKKCLQSDSN